MGHGLGEGLEYHRATWKHIISHHVMKALSLVLSCCCSLYSTLRQEIEQERHHQKQFLNKRQCACCEQPLGVLFNSGAYCPDCHNLVCKQCRRTPCEPPPDFVCTVCAKQRYAATIDAACWL